MELLEMSSEHTLKYVKSVKSREKLSELTWLGLGFFDVCVYVCVCVCVEQMWNSCSRVAVLSRI